MEDYKFTSKIDGETGRFVIPKRMLRELNWENLSCVDVSIDTGEGRIIITSPETLKTVCSKCNKVMVRSDFKFCPYCGEKLYE